MYSAGSNHPPPMAVETYPPPPTMAIETYPPPPPMGYPPQTPGQGYPPQAHGQGYPPQTPGQGYPPQTPGQGYPPPGQGYPQPPTGGGQNYSPAMGAQNYPQMANPMVVVGPQFCSPYPMDLSIAKKVLAISDNSFSVSDVNGNTIFNVKGVFFSIRDRRVLTDAYGQPLVSLQQKILTAHRRWQVYRGESSNELLFSVKKSSLIQLATKLDVFLASNTKEDVCDYHIKGSWFERSCTIYAGETTNIVAQMHKKHNVSSIVLGKEFCPFAVTIYPNVDYAFIIALVVVLNEINVDRKG